MNNDKENLIEAARIEERAKIITALREWGCPHDGIDYDHMLGLIEAGEHLK